MAQLGFIHTAGALATLPQGKSRGRVSRGKNYMWDDRGYRAFAYAQARKMVKNTAKRAADIAKDGMKDIPGPAAAGGYPAIQSGNLQNAIDHELMEENRYYIKARFGVFGDVAKRSQADYDPNNYSDETPVGEYAFTLAAGRGDGKQWPWVQKTIDDIANEGWVDVEAVGGRMISSEVAISESLLEGGFEL